MHNPLGHYSNGGSNPYLAQAQTLEGIIRFDMDHEQTAAWNAELDDNDTVPHYKRWLMEERNELAERAGKLE